MSALYQNPADDHNLESTYDNEMNNSTKINTGSWRRLHVSQHLYPVGCRPCLRMVLSSIDLKRLFMTFFTFLGIGSSLYFLFRGAYYIFTNRSSFRESASLYIPDRNVTPIACHSHNDYWRARPLVSALSAGCISVEADIWLSNHQVLVGHTYLALRRQNTLQDLYINPLLEILYQNNHNKSLHLLEETAPGVRGVFLKSPSQTLVLLIDFKTDGNLLWPYLVDQVKLLREHGYLTYLNATGIVHRPVTLVVTGNAPFKKVIDTTDNRDIFFDAPLESLGVLTKQSKSSTTIETAAQPTGQTSGNTSFRSNDDSFSADNSSTYNGRNSYYASTNFRRTIGRLSWARFSEEQLNLLRSQIQEAHSLGLRVRYWSTPDKPKKLRNYIWRTLLREGVDILNIDDLAEADKLRHDLQLHVN